jgi:hypothetical protein
MLKDMLQLATRIDTLEDEREGLLAERERDLVQLSICRGYLQAMGQERERAELFEVKIEIEIERGRDRGRERERERSWIRSDVIRCGEDEWVGRLNL